MPVRDRQRVNGALNRMKEDPFVGDVVAMKGEYQGLFRRRIGPWRLIFELDPERHPRARYSSPIFGHLLTPPINETGASPPRITGATS